MKRTKKIDFEVMKSALELHIKEMLAYKQYSDLALEYATKLDEETGIKGISCEEKIPTSSIKMTPYENELSILQYSYEIEAKHHKEKINNIRKTYSFDERFKKLSIADQTMIYETYFLGKSQYEIARETNKSQKSICNKLRDAIRRMSEVEI